MTIHLALRWDINEFVSLGVKICVSKPSANMITWLNQSVTRPYLTLGNSSLKCQRRNPVHFHLLHDYTRLMLGHCHCVNSNLGISWCVKSGQYTSTQLYCL